MSTLTYVTMVKMFCCHVSVSILKVQIPPKVTVSSGGMLTQKLNVDDLQWEKGTFDGTMAYAQNKVKSSTAHTQHYGAVCPRLCQRSLFVHLHRGSR